MDSFLFKFWEEGNFYTVGAERKHEIKQRKNRKKGQSERMGWGGGAEASEEVELTLPYFLLNKLVWIFMVDDS